MARGRKPGFTMTDEHRTKIGNSQILKCLIEHAQGMRKMSATQVTAGLGLLRKVLPDLSAADNKSEVIHRYVADLPAVAESTEQWQQQNAPTIQ
jgi:hypothetical protein